MKDMYVEIPDEEPILVEFTQDGMPAFGYLNRALVDFEPKIVFRWHLSLWLELTDLIDNGMPSQAQRDLIDPFGDALDVEFKGDTAKPNALFLGRITWNASRELIYRVYDPEPADAILRRIIDDGNHPCEFDFRIDDDPDWERAAWHLEAVSG